MDKKLLENIRRSIIRRKQNLTDWFRDHSYNTYVLPDGTAAAGSILNSGGLQVVEELDHAIDKLDHGSFGECRICHEEVEAEQLIMDFTSEVCLTHYSADQLTELERDLELATKVQQHLLPGKIPDVPGMKIAVLAKPARIVSGDYHDFFSFRDHQQGFAIADVMGKGVSASMLMSNLQASLRILGPEINDLDVLAGRLNKLFRYNLKLIRFITLFLGAVDVEKGLLHYCNAGHNPPLLLKADQTAAWLNPTGPAIGLTPDFTFKSGTVKLDSGDIIVLYTDGLVEARNKDNDEFTRERVEEYARNHSSDPADVFLNGLTREAVSFTKNFHDDLTIMVLKMD